MECISNALYALLITACMSLVPGMAHLHKMTREVEPDPASTKFFGVLTRHLQRELRMTAQPLRGKFQGWKCEFRNNSAFLNSFRIKLAKIFNNEITSPFQCNIVNTIASEHVKGARTRISLQTVEQLIGLNYPFVDVRNKCAKVWKPLKERIPLQHPAALLNITVRLHKGTSRKSWLKSLRSKARTVYNIYTQHYKKGRKQRPLIPQRNSPSLMPQYNTIVRMNIVRVSRFNGTIAVVLKLEVSDSRTMHFKSVTPSKAIVDALLTKKHKFLNSLFAARVIAITRAEKEQVSQPYSMTHRDITHLRKLFPEFLKHYYKRLVPLERCLIMLYISSIVQIDLRPTELVYNTFNYIPRKYFCTSRRRQANSNPIVDRSEKYRAGTATPRVYHDVSPSMQSVPVKKPGPKSENTSDTGDTSSKDWLDEEYVEEKKPVSVLEIVLFTVLGLLCIAILAFTVNCVIFALKPKSTDENQPNSAFSKALFRKVPAEDGGDEEPVNVAVNPRIAEGAIAEGACMVITEIDHNIANKSNGGETTHGQSPPKSGCYGEYPSPSLRSCDDLDVQIRPHPDSHLHKGVSTDDLKDLLMGGRTYRHKGTVDGTNQHSNSHNSDSCLHNCTIEDTTLHANNSSLVLEDQGQPSRRNRSNSHNSDSCLHNCTIEDTTLHTNNSSLVLEDQGQPSRRNRSNSHNSDSSDNASEQRTIKEGSGELRIFSGGRKDCGIDCACTGVSCANCTVVVVLDKEGEATGVSSQ
ncbi:predicted protein [Nematostella vectensis]|uniref:Transmembrane protein TMEM132 C-terminal domain-containing protein n=1 Tax=Nematostella vectensis TaxID=45351 RepID=A7SG01_NEMVE|nr:predicted protein [Nematostella vectensis]|eukprot:XP_001629436.1 predicted protein [Nematostella vectensis]